MENATKQLTDLFSGVRGSAVKILNRVERTDSYLDKLVNYELHENKFNDLDKNLLFEIVHGVLRWKLKLDWILTGFFHGNFSKSEISIRNALRVGLYQIIFLQKIPHHASVNEAVELIKRLRGEKAASLVNAVLRNIIRNVNEIHYPKLEEDKIQYLSVMYSHPWWIVKRWFDRFGFDETEKLLIANNRIPDLSIRVNSIKMEADKFAEFLKTNNVIFSRSEYLPTFFKTSSFPDIFDTELFKQGFISIQDESAGIACQLLSPKENESIIDLCAAPGGKSTFMAEMMKNKGNIIAVEKYQQRINLVNQSAARLNLSIIKPITADGCEFTHEEVDKVLVDAPCSGLGVIAKKPDIKLKREPSDLQNLSNLQTELLKNAAKLVKNDGIIVYSTCTIEPEENILLVQKFLSENSNFKIDSAEQFCNSKIVNQMGIVETFPHIHNMDGSFAVRLRRTE
ncbi:MAG: 16S rRNA (cytosine(967)-C(5))-methyltransferase RsmB [Bacteroidetes bacterium]|nr:16S rRNA (cytosine(967)-C(5))-methyltransferase RsmB [Bacteroidota bacterium]